MYIILSYRTYMHTRNAYTRFMYLSDVCVTRVCTRMIIDTNI